jgi:hypothetical protein
MDRSHSFIAQGFYELAPEERFDIGTWPLKLTE